LRCIVVLGCAIGALAGCGGSSDAGAGGKAAEPKPIRVAALGDSITAGNPNYDPDPRQRRALGFGDDPRSQYEYWASRADSRLRFRNCGVFGETTEQIAARLHDCANGADALIVQGGINDIAQGRPVEDAARNLRAIVDRGLSLALRVAVCDVLPWNNGWPAKEAPIRELNALIAAFGVPLLPFHDTLEDPDQPGRMRPEWTDADGDHPSVAGYRRLGELAFRLP
jgi:lysophospholipase L1-like esterase